MDNQISSTMTSAMLTQFYLGYQIGTGKRDFDTLSIMGDIFFPKIGRETRLKIENFCMDNMENSYSWYDITKMLAENPEFGMLKDQPIIIKFLQNIDKDTSNNGKFLNCIKGGLSNKSIALTSLVFL